MLLKDKAICIRAVDYSETSQVLTFLTCDHGKMSALAKGSKRPRSAFAGPVEVLSYGDAVVLERPNSPLCILTEFQPKSDIVRAVSQVLARYHVAILGAELVDRFTRERDPHAGLYQCLMGFLHEVIGGQLISALIDFELQLLRHAGMGPVMDACANCRRPFAADWGRVYFSTAANGMLCMDCEGAFPDRTEVSTRSVQALLDRQVLKEMPGQVQLGLERLVLGHIGQILGRLPRSAQLVLKTLACQDRRSY